MAPAQRARYWGALSPMADEEKRSEMASWFSGSFISRSIFLSVFVRLLVPDGWAFQPA
jgi:hypothetical protein